MICNTQLTKDIKSFNRDNGRKISFARFIRGSKTLMKTSSILFLILLFSKVESRSNFIYTDNFRPHEIVGTVLKDHFDNKVSVRKNSSLDINAKYIRTQLSDYDIGPLPAIELIAEPEKALSFPLLLGSFIPYNISSVVVIEMGKWILHEVKSGFNNIFRSKHQEELKGSSTKPELFFSHGSFDFEMFGICDLDLSGSTTFNTLSNTQSGSSSGSICGGSWTNMNVSSIDVLLVSVQGLNCNAFCNSTFYINGTNIGTNRGSKTTTVNVQNTNTASLTYSVPNCPNITAQWFWNGCSLEYEDGGGVPREARINYINTTNYFWTIPTQSIVSNVTIPATYSTLHGIDIATPTDDYTLHISGVFTVDGNNEILKSGVPTGVFATGNGTMKKELLGQAASSLYEEIIEAMTVKTVGTFDNQSDVDNTPAMAKEPNISSEIST